MGNDLTIVEKLILHYHDPARQQMTEQMEEHLKKMEYCYDIVVKYPQRAIVELLMRKFPAIKRSQAYNIYQDTLDFYEKERGKTYSAIFWKITGIDFLESLKQSAEKVAKTPKDFDYVARIQERINKLRGFYDKSPALDPESLKPATILISFGGTGDSSNIVEIGKKPEGLPDGFTPTIDATDFSVFDMEKELKKLGDNAD